MKFWDRLYFLVLGMAIVALGLAFSYGLWLAANVHPGIYVTEQLDRAIGLASALALPPTLVVMAGGLWCLYQALKED